MVPHAILDALQNDERYAKAVASLAGIRTASTDGLHLDIARYWDGDKFVGPTHLSISLPDVGRVSWTVPEKVPYIFKQTLQKLESQFHAMAIPPTMSLFYSVLSKFTKKPHFKALTFIPVDKLPEKRKAEIHLERTDWDAEELEKNVRDLIKARRKLKGMGFGDATD